MNKDLPNVNGHAAEVALRAFMPPMIRTLIEKGLLDKSKVNDKDYVLQVITENSKFFDEMGVILLMHDNFLKSALTQ